MANLKYYLKNPNAKNYSSINLIFHYGFFEVDPKSGRKKYKSMKMSTGEKIEPKFWNQDKCRAKETRSFPQYPEFNLRLNNFENTVQNVFRRLINDGGFPHPTKLKEEILKETNKAKIQATSNLDQIDFFDFIEQIIEESKNGLRLTPKGKHFSMYTIKGYGTTLNHLKKFQQRRKERIDFENIDMNFYNALVNWFYAQNKAKNTVGEHIKNLKVFMGEAFERKISKNIIFKSKKFKILEEDTDTIYLSDDEMDRMLALDLSSKPGMELARDNFLLDCYIGLRIADFGNLKKNHIIEVQGTKMISIVMQKTEHSVMVPLKKNALDILEKYDYEIKTNTDQAMNRKIKEIGKLAGIDDDITTTITRGGKRVTTVIKKYNLITNHTARRSFATNLYLAGIPTLAIMKMTGHKTEKSFLKYIRVTSEENAVTIAQHPYFAT